MFSSHYRWRIVALLFFATAINYMDRQIIGLLKPTLEVELGWSERDYSNIVSCFQFAYAAGYLLSGRVMDRIGVRWGMSLAIGVWSLFNMGHAFVRSVFGFGFMRLGLGLAEGGNFPGAIKAVSEWFPRKERALATGIFNAGSSIGAMVAPFFVPWIAVEFGWPAAFIVTGIIGLVLVAVWIPVYRAPEQAKGISPEELAHIRSDPPEPPAPQIPWIGLLKFRFTWGYAASTMFTSPVWWFYLFWVPGYLNKTFGVDMLHVGPPLVVIYLMSDFGAVAGGWLSMQLLKRGWTVRKARLFSMLACALLVVPLCLVPGMKTAWPAIFLIGLAAFAHQGWASNLFTLVSDNMPKSSVASVVGFGGMASSFAAIGAAQAIGLILDRTGSYGTLFSIASVCYLIALSILTFATARRPAA